MIFLLSRGGGRRMSQVASTYVFSFFTSGVLEIMSQHFFETKIQSSKHTLGSILRAFFSLIVVFWGARGEFPDLAAAPRRKHTKKQRSCSKKGLVCDAFALPPRRLQMKQKRSSRSEKGLVCDALAVSRWQGENSISCISTPCTRKFIERMSPN